MKTQRIQNTVAVIAVAGFAFLASSALAQNSPAAAPPVAATVAAPPMTSGASEILRMAQAKISDDTILAYIKTSGANYGLNADQIIYLRQQGVSTDVLNAMLSQPVPALAPATASTAPAPQPSASTATVAPAVTYVQTVPSTTYYYSSPYYYPAYYGGYYGWGYPAVSLSFGWGGGWGGHWGGGGWGGHGGWHR